jgi:hypothetical protein
MRDVPIHRVPLRRHSLRMYAPCLAAWGGMFDHSAVKRSPSIFTRYSLPVDADFQICGNAVAFAADFVLAGLGVVWFSEEYCNEVAARIPHNKMIHQNRFVLKGFSSLSSVLIHSL